MDNHYYKKNAQLRYHISKEFKRYLKEKGRIEKNKTNPFVLSFFSATVTISTTIVSVLGTRNIQVICPIIYLVIPLGAILFFILVYFSSKKASIFIEKIKKRKEERKVLNTPTIYITKEEILNKFNFDIVHLIYFAYELTHNEEIKDNTIIEFNHVEAIFYLKRAINKLKGVFISYPFFSLKESLPLYRVETILNMQRMSLLILEDTYKDSNESKYIDVYNLIKSFDNIISEINKIYQSKLQPFNE